MSTVPAYKMGFYLPKSGNTLEGDVSDVMALDQPTALFFPRKATRMSP